MPDTKLNTDGPLIGGPSPSDPGELEIHIGNDVDVDLPDEAPDGVPSGGPDGDPEESQDILRLLLGDLSISDPREMARMLHDIVAHHRELVAVLEREIFDLRMTIIRLSEENARLSAERGQS